EWWPDKAKLRVVIILENKCVVSTRKIEQIDPTLKAHGNAERKLMRRRYVDHPWQCFFWRPCNHDSVGVDRLGNYFNAGQTENSLGLLITRVFDPCGLTRIEHSQCADQHRLLHTSHDDDLIGMTARRSEIAQVRCNCLAQVDVAAIR